MKALRPRPRSEASIQAAIRRRLEAEGWLVEKSHGNQFQAGWPDLYCHHPELGARWIEVKTPRGRLTQAQRVLFPKWERFGVGIWILKGEDEVALLSVRRGGR